MMLISAVSARGRQLSIKLALKYAQLRDVEGMCAVACANQTRDLAALERMLRDYYREELSIDHDLIAPRCAIRHFARAQAE
jgi:26S proteasome regulatory subunit N6